MKSLRPFLMLWILAGLLACTAPAAPTSTPSSALPTPVDPAPASPTPDPSPISLTSTAAPTPSTTPSPPPPATAMPDVYGIIAVDDGILLGGISSITGEWLAQPGLAAESIVQPFSVYQRGTYLDELSLERPLVHTCPDGGRAVRFPIARNLFPTQPLDMLAISSSGPIPVIAGQASWLSGVPAVYEDVIRAWLADEGLVTDEIEIRNVITLDLDGNGIQEVVIDAGRVVSHLTTSSGDYSVILLRVLVGDMVETIPLASEVYPSSETGTPPVVHYLTSITDLNGDAVPELVVDTIIDVGRRTDIYEARDLQPELVLTAPCRLDIEPERLELMDQGIYELQGP